MRIRHPRRKAATVIESALMISLALLFLFSIFEYCRFIFLLQTAENAAREGARFAIARTADGTTLADVQNQVDSKMAGRQNELTGYSVEVLNVYPDTGEPVPNTAWNDAPFGGAILVRVTGTYQPMLPSFLKTQTAITITTTSMMTSEAN